MSCHFVSSVPSAGSALQDSAFGYFITACVVILLAMASYIALPRMVRPSLLPTCPFSTSKLFKLELRAVTLGRLLLDDAFRLFMLDFYRRPELLSLWRAIWRRICVISRSVVISLWNVSLPTGVFPVLYGDQTVHTFCGRGQQDGFAQKRCILSYRLAHIFSFELTWWRTPRWVFSFPLMMRQ